jgi:hypothetical protein
VSMTGGHYVKLSKQSIERQTLPDILSEWYRSQTHMNKSTMLVIRGWRWINLGHVDQRILKFSWIGEIDSRYLCYLWWLQLLIIYYRDENCHESCFMCSHHKMWCIWNNEMVISFSYICSNVYTYQHITLYMFLLDS